ncbi:Mobile element protein [Rhodovulum sp. P5]|nr:Mobile element protein [Rhodovulum sp. P5]
MAAHVMNSLERDPFSGEVFIFRSKRADRLKMIVWDGTGLVLIHKRIEGRGFVWPSVRHGVVQVSSTQFEALFEGLDWRRIATARQHRPVAI